MQNIYIRKVEKVGGRLQNTVIATFPAVGQFWKYNPDEYMKPPLYSRDYPPCKHCQSSPCPLPLRGRGFPFPSPL